MPSDFHSECRRRRLRQSSCALLMSILPSACMNANKHAESSVLAPPETFVRHDPDPDKDPAGPKFCNPSGKNGEELRLCYEQNEAIYKEFDEEAKKREPWFNFTPDSWLNSTELDNQYVVTVALLDQAIAKLEKQPIIELSPTEAAQLTAKPAMNHGRKPYLVRALYYARDTGSFAVYQRDEKILVRHDSFSQELSTEKRAALVVYLPYKPKEVYVDCTMTQGI